MGYALQALEDTTVKYTYHRSLQYFAEQNMCLPLQWNHCLRKLDASNSAFWKGSLAISVTPERLADGNIQRATQSKFYASKVAGTCAMLCMVLDL
jgi:hypothetical protein